MIVLDDYYMGLALQQAAKAAESGEVPVGALVVSRGQIIGKGYNQTVRLNDPTAHAEMIAITGAANFLGNTYLTGCTLFVTLEPCPMCAGAMHWAQLDRLVFGASDDKRGYRLFSPSIIHRKTLVTEGVLEQECAHVLSSFFKKLRK